MKTLLKLALGVVLLGALGLGIRSWVLGSSGTAGAVYRTAPVERGELVAVISATGTVEPEEVVDVGAQVAGKIDAFGSDTEGNTVDYGSTVEEGTVLARGKVHECASPYNEATCAAQQKTCVEGARTKRNGAWVYPRTCR